MSRNIDGGEVLTMLCPNVDFYISGNDYENINWFDKPPAVTKSEYLAGFDKLEKWEQSIKEEKVKTRASAQVKLAALGLTPDEVTAIIGA